VLKTPFEVKEHLLKKIINDAPVESIGSNNLERILPRRPEVLLQCMCIDLPCAVLTRFQTATKQSKWDMPEELLLILEKVEKEAGPIAAPTYVSPIIGLNQ
jgi:hypothetical protein